MNDYSPGEVAAMYDRATKQYTQDLYDSLIVGRYAQHADGKAMKKFMQQLQKVFAERQYMSADDVARAFGAFLKS